MELSGVRHHLVYLVSLEPGLEGMVEATGVGDVEVPQHQYWTYVIEVILRGIDADFGDCSG